MSTQKINPEVAELMVLFYQSVRNAYDYCCAINSSEDAPAALKQNYFRPLALKMQVSIKAIELGMRGNQEMFNRQLRFNDLIRFDEIKRLMLLMTPEQQAEFEEFGLQLAKLPDLEAIPATEHY